MKITILARGASHRLRIETRDAAGKRVFAYETVRGSALDAEQRRLELLRAYAAGIVTQPSDETLRAFARRWIDRRLADGLIQQTTADQYDYALAAALDRLGDKRVADVTADDVKDFYRAHSAVVGQGTLRTTHAVLGSVFKAAVKARLIAVSPLEDVRAPKAPSSQKKALTAAQARALMDYAADRPLLRIIVALALSAGLRRGEIAALRWRDVDFETGRITVARQIVRVGKSETISRPKSDAGAREVAIPAAILDELRDSAGLPDEPVVMTSHGARPSLTYLSRIVKEGLQAIGLDEGYSLHSTRHTHATHLLRSTRNIKAVSRRLGHADVSVTLRVYAKVLDSDDGELAAAIGAVMA